MATVMRAGNFGGTSGGEADLRGMTVRQSLKALRRVDWGETGGMEDVLLSDGSYLRVGLRKDSGGATIFNSQIAVRWAEDDLGQFHHVRYYSLRRE
jgi:hypothetical protein